MKYNPNKAGDAPRLASTRILDVKEHNKNGGGGGGDNNKGRANMTFLKRAFGSQLDLTGDDKVDRLLAGIKQIYSTDGAGTANVADERRQQIGRNNYRTVESQTDCQLFFIGAATDGDSERHQPK